MAEADVGAGVKRALTLICGLALAVGSGCSGGSDPDTDGADTDPVGPLPVCETPAEVSCVDEILLDLSLQDDPTDDGVETVTDGEDFVTTLDASAGGFGQETNNPFVYVRFEADGVAQVDISDEDALESMDWDLSARRFILRLNGGSSGPSCVGAAPFLERAYADLNEVPDGTVFYTDDFYTEDCTIINDSSGLPGSPQVALGAWWEYPGCVATTMRPFLVQTASGGVLKMVVEAYYGEDQEGCNENSTPGQDSGKIRIRWRWVEPPP